MNRSIGSIALLVISGAFLLGFNTMANPTLVPGTFLNITPSGVNLAMGFGCNDIRVDPSNPATLYACVDQQGMWKTTDAGSNWTKIGNLDSPLHLQIDPHNGQHLVVCQGVRGNTQGFWISTNGGTKWDTAAATINTWSHDVYYCTADPTDFNHILLTFHGPWVGLGSSGVLETKDGGVTWIPHQPISTWGYGHWIAFLGNRHTWLLGTQGDGFWRTADSGTTWTKVITANSMTHGGDDMYYSKSTKMYYIGAGIQSSLYRSADTGKTWTAVGPFTYSGYYSVVGDGYNLYTCDGFTGTGGSGKYYTSKESDGLTWTKYQGGAQTFVDGPFNQVFDSTNKIIYSANWNAGILALRVIDPASAVSEQQISSKLAGLHNENQGHGRQQWYNLTGEFVQRQSAARNSHRVLISGDSKTGYTKQIAE